jgi:hypothetical protein
VCELSCEFAARFCARSCERSKATSAAAMTVKMTSLTRNRKCPQWLSPLYGVHLIIVCCNTGQLLVTHKLAMAAMTPRHPVRMQVDLVMNCTRDGGCEAVHRVSLGFTVTATANMATMTSLVHSVSPAKSPCHTAVQSPLFWRSVCNRGSNICCNPSLA